MSLGSPLGLPTRGCIGAPNKMNVLALVTDAFGGLGGIAQYNRDLLAALSARADGGRIIVLRRNGTPDLSELPQGLRQLAPKQNKVAYAFATFRTALTQGPYDVVFCG